MKKVYLFLTLALLCCVDAFSAVFTPGEMKATIAAGDYVFIGTPYSQAGLRDNGLKWMSNRKNILTYTEGETPISADVFVVEAANQTVNGKAAFYLKNERQGLYVKAKEISNGGAEDDLTSSTLIFTENVAEACPFAIVSAPEGAELMNYKGEREVPADAFMFMTKGIEEGEWIALNQAYSAPTVVTYNDWATWFEVYTAEAMEDPLAELIDLFLEVEAAVFVNGADSAPTFVGGTNPGTRADTTTVNNFYKLFAEVYEFVDGGEAENNPDACPAKTAQLKDAYYGLLKTETIPMHEGYYRFASANNDFLTRDKYMVMYATGNKAMWGPRSESAINQIWEVKKQGEDTWLAKNMDTQMYFLNNSDGVVMGATTENYTVFEALDIDGQFWIKMQSPNTPLHCNNHGGGNGTGSNIVVWNAGAGSASSWFIEEVTEEELAEINEANKQEQLDNQFAALLADARNKYNVATEYEALLTSPEQIRSNASQSEWGNADGGGYPALIDGDPQTFFHSCWQNGPDEPHYLAFTLNKEVSDPLRFSWTRRVAQAYGNNNCPSNVTLAIAPAGADTTVAENWTTIAELTEMHKAVSQDNPTYSSWNAYELPFPAKYVRWTVTLTGPNSKQLGNQYFFTMGEFQLYGALNPDCQLAQMGEVGIAFKAAIDEALTVETVTQADIDKLQAALDAFKAQLADPTELNNMIATAGSISSGIVYGTNPGQYPEGSAEEETLAVALEQAEALIESGAYTQTSLAEALATLTDAYNAFVGLATPIKTGKWYTINFPSTYYEMTGTDKLVMSGKAITLDGTSDAALPGVTQMHMVNFDEVADPDMALWRFVAIGDTAFAIQNKATGMYMVGGGGARTLSISPSMIKTTDKGYSCFLLDAFRLNDVHLNPIHCQTVGEIIVGWPSYDLGSNSMWEIHEVEDVIDEPENYSFVSVRYGMPYMYCWPVAISEIEGASVYRISGINEENLSLYDLAEEGDGVIPAGEPFILMSGTTDEYNTGEATASDTIKVTFKFGSEIQKTPIETNYLVGTYYGTTANAKHMVFDVNDNGPVVKALTGDKNIGANSAYINLIDTKLGEAEDESTVIPTEKDFGNIVDAIHNAIANLNKGTVDVYTTTGVLVRKNVKANAAVQGLPKGIYIVGGQKTVVK